jgi:hypothetical protein
MIHHRQRLSLGVEAGDDFLGVVSRLDDLQCDDAMHRVPLFGFENRPKSTASHLFENAIPRARPDLDRVRGRHIRKDSSRWR